MPPHTRRENQSDLRRIALHPDFWYPLARSEDLERKTTRPATFAGQPLVLARTESGEVFALDDRCAHRQFPLHKGVVTGELLKCAYHAWSYRKDGVVAGCPYLPPGSPRPEGVKSYACRESQGYVFVFTGDRAKAPQVPFPELPNEGNGRRRAMHFWRQVACHYSFMHENLMDMNHQFLHRGILGTIKPTLLDYQAGDDWVEVRYKFEKAGGRSNRGANLMLAGGSAKGAKWSSGDLMVIRTQYPYQTLRLYRGGADSPAFELWTAYVPHDRAQRSNVSVGLLMIEKPPVPLLIHLAWPLIRRFAESVFEEDRMAVEAEQRAYDLAQADWNQEINPVILALRDVLARNGRPLVPESLRVV
jgi:renierapurpurin 18,18'-hydroxylase